MKYFEGLKVAHDKFTWNGKKYHAQVDMVESTGKIVWLWDLDARVNSTLSTEFLAQQKMVFEANIQH